MKLSFGRATRLGLWFVGLLGLQALALLGYRAMEARRESTAAVFRYERLGAEGRAPALQLERPDGTPVDVSPGEGDEAVLLHFWATWCPPCREELPALLDLGRKLSAGRRVRLVAVATDTTWAAIEQFFKGEIPEEVLRDATGQGYTAYGVYGLPDTYLIPGGGRARIRFAGARDWGSAGAIEFLERELQPPATE